ncbi:hypothetical protein D3C72_992610 [compost metagenome]
MENQSMNQVKIAVGEKFPLFPEGTKRVIGTDAAFFEANEFNQGYSLCVYLTDISFGDIQSFRNDKITMKVLQANDGIVLPLIKIGNTMLFEMSFNPVLYSDDRYLQLAESNNILSMFLIESRTGTVKAIRQCNLPLKMIQICREAWSRAMLDPNFTAKFNEWSSRMSKYPIRTLWDRATSAGALGETYSLQEINMPNQYKPQKNI